MSTPSSSADRNLIFGLLALQIDFVTREQFLDAMNAWMLDKQTPLGEILCRRGFLDEDDRADIDRLVAEHIKRHGGDAQTSLAALRVEQDVRQNLNRLDDTDVQTSIASLAPPPVAPQPMTTEHDASEDSVASAPSSAPTSFASAGVRFRRLREHARGGLGEVFVALDEELSREVALKEIQDRFADHPDSRARFLREAEITGKLEHPGVVPIYGMGAYPDGRPFYAMRFIRGESMQEAIHRFHNADEDPRRDPGERSLALRELLTRFVAVCNAVGYAHARGVVHRDLKGPNVMLGEYGETLVVDWGLACLREQPETEQPTAERPVLLGAGSGTSPTQEGQVSGTPAYMPPEQALGRLDRIGPASDVFSLGATLYCLLTGDAPYSGEAVVAQARRGEVTPARQRKRSVPAALEAVCAKAMAFKPEDRYASAKVLAEDVQRWLADEPVMVYREPLTVRLRRLAKRHRTLASAMAVGLVTATVALAVGLVAVNAEKNRTEAARQQTQTALEAEQAALGRSQASEKSAKEQRQLALKTVRYVVNDIHARLKDRPGHKTLRKDLLARALDGLKDVARAADTEAQVDHETIWVHLELGDIFLQIEEGGTTEAKNQYQTAHALARQCADADPTSVQARRDLSVSYSNLGDVQMQLGDTKAALAAYKRYQEIAERLAKADPASVQAQRDLSVSYSNLGTVQMQRGDTKTALAAYKHSLEICERLAKADPSSVQAQRDLSVSYSKLGDVQMQLGDAKAALEPYKHYQEIAERLASADPRSAQAQRDLSVSYGRLGNVQMQLGDTKAALEAYKHYQEIAERLANADPSSAQAQRDLSVSYGRLGNVQMQLGDAKAALVAYKHSLEIDERLANADPSSVQAQRDLSVSYSNLGDVQMQLRDAKAALESYKHYQEIAERLAKAAPTSAQAQRDLSASYGKLGDVQMQLGDTKAALQASKHSLKIDERLANADPTSAQAQRDLLLSCLKLGSLEQRTGEFRKAADWYARALVAADFLAANAKGPGHLYDAACGYALNAALADKPQTKEKHAARAVELLRQAVAKGYKNAAHMKKDADLDVLRGRDDFKKLVAELEAAARPKEAKEP